MHTWLDSAAADPTWLTVFGGIAVLGGFATAVMLVRQMTPRVRIDRSRVARRT
ncbi:hypothetical protein [Agrococcus carbonis]|uniref:Uncharacterized protein n=1 Tax=Agrococcus carbonis TaxID=684552 RepID=A0A1H1QB20_9MICO|nr:hypothetical protein [Agrococcus carbonis]SDS20574.1 hypothetical protein SAMN04489719_1785 [Agrococcus carbonis]